MVDPDNILIFELQGKPQSKKIVFSPEDFDIYSGTGTGYPLWRNRDDDEGLNIDIAHKIGDEETLAWSVLDLFNQKGDLIRGNFKVPVYEPPAYTNIDLHMFHQIATPRIPLTNMFMRIESYYTTDSNKLKSGNIQPSIEISH